MSQRKPVTEDGWLSAQLLAPLLQCLRDRGVEDDRKLRLFAVACCRRVWHQVIDARLQATVEVGEAFAEGRAQIGELSPALDEATRALMELCDRSGHDYSTAVRRAPHAYDRGHPAVIRWGIAAACCVTERAERAAWIAEAVANTKEIAVNCALLRCIFGNPFRPVAFLPDWRTDTVRALARQMYDSREFSAMPILADALQDAGCEHGGLLSHCRDAAQLHARGCWMLDAVLQKG